MVQDNDHILLNNLLYSCVDAAQRGNEQFVAEHSLGYVIAGEVQCTTADGMGNVKEGTIGLIKRNQLLKTVKMPPPGGEFKAINIFFGQDILRRYSMENNIHAAGPYLGEKYRVLPDDPFIKGYFESLLPYFDQPGRLSNTMIELKTKEALELVLKIEPSLKELLFDFAEPHKINLEAFMNQNYMYNVPVDNFAKLTGRSLAAFKRDFGKIFNTSPGQWLQEKRLNEAYYLIKEKGIKPSAAYLDVGFENLSHFSFAFKKAFGVSPSLI
ncbi:helix-turn-helix domain-containing protein [Mucilaginibacter agri]|uniref:Helix-turn-helix domain-containing protein n=1 Tax=Mucilaginibacter agri TaxID=2695265 RepID=A0A966DTC5_9SPHI|nr:AraC family transcriptional regulator [Mucilaginibacter agri]NCD69187.1 helix-turn-helix domain-containing protein [Mucilaginibacter agri]